MRELSDLELEGVVGGLSKALPSQMKPAPKSSRRVATSAPVVAPKASGGSCANGVCRPA